MSDQILELGYYRVTVISGQTGSGKTSWAVHQVLGALQALGEAYDWDERTPTFYSNIAFREGPLAEAYPEIAERLQRFVHPYERDGGGPLWGEPTPESNPITNAVIVIDEAQGFHAIGGKITSELNLWITKKRVRHLEIIMILPNANVLPKVLRDGCACWFHVVDLTTVSDKLWGILPAPPVRQVVKCDALREGIPHAARYKWMVPKWALELYDTQGGTWGMETPGHLRMDATNSAKRRGRALQAFMIGVSIMAVIFGAALRYAWRSMTSFGKKEEVRGYVAQQAPEVPKSKQVPVRWLWRREADWKAIGGEGDRTAYRSPNGQEWIEWEPGSLEVVPWKP